ncbi:guanine nucleotide binding protein, alpha subunit [Hysterangium stoloniferum]|nr:guanine nucleotide binding protein, alpha subunit [Hysterangium stoloniferum]
MADTDNDPLTLALKPPVNETPEERALRVEREREAIRVSEEIDRDLRREQVERKKNKAEIKILLLGPSGSGKSTTLKNFQLLFTPKALQAEATKYTALVFLNVVTSIRQLFDIVNDPQDQLADIQQLRDGCEQLKPIMAFEMALANWLWEDGNVYTSRQSLGAALPNAFRTPYEMTVYASGARRAKASPEDSSGPSDALSVVEQVRQLLVTHHNTIEFISNHPSTHALLAALNRRLEHMPGYFLNDLKRIIAPEFSPTDDDILRTRIRTMGVSETRFKVESGPDKGLTWAVFDVGGSRNQRAAWIPYFDDVDTIIFIAPVGHFDQFLEEERGVNCLRDTFELWELIVSNKLLAMADMILFLNKYDILVQKLEMGVKFSKFVTSYKDRNDAEAVSRYLQKKFVAVHQQRCPTSNRILQVHLTSVTDRSGTATLITHCRETVLRNHFKGLNLL